MADVEDVYVEDAAVLQSMDKALNEMHPRVKQGFKSVVDACCELAPILQVMEQHDQVEQLQQCVQSIASTCVRFDAHTNAVLESRQSFEASLDITDFASLWNNRAAALLDEQGEDAAQRHEYMTSFRAMIGDEDNVGGDAFEGDDDDIMVAAASTSIAVNAKCPLSGKNVMDIAEPVEDEKGYVYEKSHIVKYIRDKQGRCECPAIGTRHIVTERGLKPAERVVRQQRLNRFRSTQQPAANDNAVLL